MRSALNIQNVKNWLMVAYTFGGVIDHFSVAKIILIFQKTNVLERIFSNPPLYERKLRKFNGKVL